MNNEMLIKSLKNGLIVSCQALPDEPLYTVNGGVMPLFAKAAQEAGAIGIRANSVRDIIEIKKEVNLPIIGIIKRNFPLTETYITPTMEEVDALVKVQCEIIATDFTTQSREGGVSASDFLKQIKEKYPHQLIMADCATLNDAILAEKAGADFIGTTMNGYTSDSEITPEPNYKLIQDIVSHCETPVIAEGRVWYPEQAKKVLESGAYCVVVGGAITRPKEIATRFVEAIKR